MHNVSFNNEYSLKEVFLQEQCGGGWVYVSVCGGHELPGESEIIYKFKFDCQLLQCLFKWHLAINMIILS